MPDVTCIRDYIHVDDLTDPHVLALDYLMESGKSDIMNCGYCHGFSVKEVEKVTSIDFAIEEKGMRAGDHPQLVADSTRLRQLTGRQPQYNNLESIIKTAWEWELELRKRGLIIDDGILP